MSWFSRQAAGRSVDEVSREHARYVRAAGVDRALDQLAGPFGLRRFVLRFHAVPTGGGRHRIDLDALLTMPLAAGGGPPPEDPTGEGRAALQQALARLHANMSTGPVWSRGAVGYLRDSGGRTRLLLWFDDDADGAHLDDLPVPPGQGHPLEQPAWHGLVANLEPRMEAVHARGRSIPSDHDVWAVEDDQLVLRFRPLPPGPDGAERWQDVRRYRCHPVATFHPRHQRLTWQTDRRPGGALFSEDDLSADWAAAHEVALAAAVELGASWLFSGEFGERGERLYAAAFDETMGS